MNQMEKKFIRIVKGEIMSKYDIYKNGKLQGTVSFTSEEIKHLRESKYGSKKGISIRKHK